MASPGWSLNGNRLTTSDNVGVGTGAPASTLDVGGGLIHVGGTTTPSTTAQGAYLGWNALTGGTGETDFINNQGLGTGGFAFMNTPASGSPRTTLMVITGAGNVGIGTTTPSYSLHLAAGKILRLEGGTGASDATDYFSIGGNGSFGIDAPGVPNGRFIVENSGNVGIGTPNPTSTLEVNGNIGVNGNINAGELLLSMGADITGNVGIALTEDDERRDGEPSSPLVVHGDIRTIGNGNVSVSGDVLLTGADCAEHFDVTGDLPEPGTVVVIDESGALRESLEAYDKRVAGVVSGAGDFRHGLVLDKRSSDDGRVPVALMGKVYCKVDAQYSPIEVGDLLTTSQTPGHAMKATEPSRAFGSVIGKSLRGLQGGKGLIPVLIALQ